MSHPTVPEVPPKASRADYSPHLEPARSRVASPILPQARSSKHPGVALLRNVAADVGPTHTIHCQLMGHGAGSLVIMSHLSHTILKENHDVVQPLGPVPRTPPWRGKNPLRD